MSEAPQGLAGIPRVVWFHWMQGQAALPPVARECLSSWTRMNPDWEVRFVDGHNAWKYLDRAAIPVDALLKTSPQVYSNAIRLSLLNDHGGVWVDATTWCRTPLSEWVTAMPGELFAFSSPGTDRMLSNWFIASRQSGYIVKTMTQAYLGIFQRLGPLTKLPEETVREALERAESTDAFVEPLLSGTHRAYPYFLFHYLFAFLYRRDDRFKKAWDEAGRIRADASHAAQRLDLLAPADDVTRQQLRAASPHVHKLVWQIERIEPGSVLNDIVTGSI
jgi:hypothetical protein